jgi:hypothetical protein
VILSDTVVQILGLLPQKLLGLNQRFRNYLD